MKSVFQNNGISEDKNLNENVMFKFLAKINKVLLPNFTKRHLDLAKATQVQKIIIAWKYYVTTRALE